ncbi:peptidoglycan DD-metalloendopeptidase family protein [Eubacteriales bacterium OttesenSCG-928-G02]|nr:peptidoglycan DD-metalloendopeptidase family protein [Eubacteriales bacterium OttesenSCG-928-G02]
MINFKKSLLGVAVLLVIMAVAMLKYLSPQSVIDTENWQESSECIEDQGLNNTINEEEQIYIKGYGMYINNEFITAAKNKKEAALYLDNMIKTYAETNLKNAYSYNLLTKVDFIEGEYLSGTFKELKEAINNDINLEFEVQYVEYKNEEVETPIIYIDNAELNEGTEKIITIGQDGSCVKEILYTYQDDTIINETELNTVVTKEAVATVIERGVKNNGGSSLVTITMFKMPYEGRITSEYGTRYLFNKTHHYGLDIAAKIPGTSCYGDKIMAAGDGKVVFAQMNGNYGNLVIIEHRNGVKTYYAHMSKIIAKLGQEVEAGDVIGNIGATGQVTAPHLHFEVKIPDGKGNYVNTDPKNYIENYNKYLYK